MITTDSKHAFTTAKNELDRDFTSLKLGEKWVSNITYIGVNVDRNHLTITIYLGGVSVKR